MKSYTDLEQSKKLAEILPHKSADMFCADVFNKKEETHSYNFHILSTWGCNTFEELKDRENKFVCFIPVWSLAALLGVLPILDNRSPVTSKTFDGKYRVLYHSTAYEKAILTSDYDNPIDACYEMIIKLHELNLL